jgi:hypothetical protein
MYKLPRPREAYPALGYRADLALILRILNEELADES